jgi:hypothetical protein
MSSHGSQQYKKKEQVLNGKYLRFEVSNSETSIYEEDNNNNIIPDFDATFEVKVGHLTRLARNIELFLEDKVTVEQMGTSIVCESSAFLKGYIFLSRKLNHHKLEELYFELQDYHRPVKLKFQINNDSQRLRRKFREEHGNSAKFWVKNGLNWQQQTAIEADAVSINERFLSGDNQVKANLIRDSDNLQILAYSKKIYEGATYLDNMLNPKIFQGEIKVPKYFLDRYDYYQREIKDIDHRLMNKYDLLSEEQIKTLDEQIIALEHERECFRVIIKHINNYIITPKPGMRLKALLICGPRCTGKSWLIRYLLGFKERHLSEINKLIAKIKELEDLPIRNYQRVALLDSYKEKLQSLKYPTNVEDDDIFNNEFIIYNRGQMNETQFYKTNAKLIIIDDVILNVWQDFKDREMLKGLCTGERVNINAKHVNFEFKNGLPMIYLTNDVAYSKRLKNDPDFGLEFNFVEVRKFMGPLELEEKVSKARKDVECVFFTNKRRRL